MGVFNVTERYILVLNLLIGLVILYFLALSVGDIFRLRVATNVLPVETSPVRNFGGAAGAQPRAAYEAIVRRDIFNLAPAPQEAAVEDQSLSIKLVGTSQLSSGKPYAIVEDQSGTQSLYRVGEDIPNAGKLLEVAQNRAVILHNGRKVSIEIPHDVQSAPLPQPIPGQIRRMPGHRGPGPRGPMGGVQRLSSNRYLLDRATVDSNLKNMAPLFTQIRATPNLENGISNGFRLSEIQPGSIFQQIGLEDGDLLKTVNGQSVGDPAKAMTLLQSLQSQRAITLNVERNGAPTQLFYNIR